MIRQYAVNILYIDVLFLTSGKRVRRRQQLPCTDEIAGMRKTRSNFRPRLTRQFTEHRPFLRRLQGLKDERGDVARMQQRKKIVDCHCGEGVLRALPGWTRQSKKKMAGHKMLGHRIVRIG